MALPKLLQKLFDDEGKGPKLKPSIIPTKINGQEPDETGEFNLQLSDPDAATRPEILTAVKKVTEASEVTFEPDESLPSVGHNIGEEWVSYTGVIPFGGIPYCGQEVTRETYRDLWEYAQTQGLVKSESEWQSIASAQNGNVAFYSTGDGSSTFRMPRLVGYVRGASGQSEAGAYIKEGLPNIIGSITAKGQASTNAEASGAFALDDTAPNASYTGMSSQSRKYSIWNFDASRSNLIYGNSIHVTPETSVVLFGVYAFGEITNQGTLDASTLATGLATVEANKLGRSDNSEIVGWGTPDYASGVTVAFATLQSGYTAPKSGLLVTKNICTGNNSRLVMLVNNTQIFYSGYASSGGITYVSELMLGKGDVARTSATEQSSFTCVFYPCKGDN